MEQLVRMCLKMCGILDIFIFSFFFVEELVLEETSSLSRD